MRRLTLETKTQTALACVNELQQRGELHLVEGIEANLQTRTPIVRLRKRPQGFEGQDIPHLRFGTHKIVRAQFHGCQLRWEEKTA